MPKVLNTWTRRFYAVSNVWICDFPLGKSVKFKRLSKKRRKKILYSTRYNNLDNHFHRYEIYDCLIENGLKITSEPYKRERRRERSLEQEKTDCNLTMVMDKPNSNKPIFVDL